MSYVEEQYPRQIHPISGSATGASVTLSVPQNTTWKIISIRVELVADANVANRYVSIRFRNASNDNMLIIDCPTVITASQSKSVNAIAGGEQFDATNEYVIPLPNGLILNPGWDILVNITSVQAADDVVVHVLAIETVVFA